MQEWLVLRLGVNMNKAKKAGMGSTNCNATAAHLFPDALLHGPY